MDGVARVRRRSTHGQNSDHVSWCHAELSDGIQWSDVSKKSRKSIFFVPELSSQTDLVVRGLAATTALPALSARATFSYSSYISSFVRLTFDLRPS